MNEWDLDPTMVFSPNAALFPMVSLDLDLSVSYRSKSGRNQMPIGGFGGAPRLPSALFGAPRPCRPGGPHGGQARSIPLSNGASLAP